MAGRHGAHGQHARAPLRLPGRGEVRGHPESEEKTRGRGRQGQRDRRRPRHDAGRLVAAARLQHPGRPGRPRRSRRRGRPRPPQAPDRHQPPSRRRHPTRVLGVIRQFHEACAYCIFAIGCPRDGMGRRAAGRAGRRGNRSPAGGHEGALSPDCRTDPDPRPGTHARTHVRHLQGPIWEMRMRGRDGMPRALYVAATGRRAVVVRAFVKRTQRTPCREIELALRRAKEVR